MQLNFLDYEQPIAELEAKIDELRYMSNDSDLNITDEIQKLQDKSVSLTESIFSSLTPWQTTQMARHPQRPYTLDYIHRLITDLKNYMVIGPMLMMLL